MGTHGGDLGGVVGGGGCPGLGGVGGHPHIPVLPVGGVHGGAAAAEQDEQQVEDGLDDEAGDGGVQPCAPPGGAQVQQLLDLQDGEHSVDGQHHHDGAPPGGGGVEELHKHGGHDQDELEPAGDKALGLGLVFREFNPVSCIAGSISDHPQHTARAERSCAWAMVSAGRGC